MLNSLQCSSPQLKLLKFPSLLFFNNEQLGTVFEAFHQAETKEALLLSSLQSD